MSDNGPDLDFMPLGAEVFDLSLMGCRLQAQVELLSDTVDNELIEAELVRQLTRRMAQILMSNYADKVHVHQSLGGRDKVIYQATMPMMLLSQKEFIDLQRAVAAINNGSYVIQTPKS